MSIMTRRRFATSLPLLLINGKSAFAGEHRRLPSVIATVNIATLTMRVYVGGEPIDRTAWPVSTANPAHTDCTYGACRTPVGNFRPTRIDAMAHAPAKFGRVPMPHAVFFDNEGDAIHATFGASEENLLGKVADSHGCVRISPKHAEIFFGLVARRERPAGLDRNGFPIYAFPGVTIIITNGSASPGQHKSRHGDDWI